MNFKLKPFLLIPCLMITPLTAWSHTLNVNIDTSILSGSLATLAFDFIDGDDAINNSLQISHLVTNGIYDNGNAILEGDVTGALNSVVTLGDSSFFNEILQPITLGHTLQFTLQTTNHLNLLGAMPDSFSFFIFDEFGSLPIFATTDQTGSDALFVLDLTGADDGLSLFTSTTASPTWTVQPVPIPGAFSMMLIAGVCSAFIRRKK